MTTGDNSSRRSPPPLAGLRILDMTRVLAGPTCTQLLGDLGAEIVKLERPRWGDDSRGMGPPWLKDERGREVESAYFLSVNRNKRSLTIDLTSERGQALAKRLMAACDVVVENFRAGDLQRYGLSWEQIRGSLPRLIYCSLTGFGQTGPYARRGGYDFLVQAMGGVMSVTGFADGPPVKVGVGVADIVTGLYAASAILAALRHRDKSGEGQRIDVALLDSQVAWLSYIGQNYLISGEVPGRIGNQHPNIAPYQVFKASDGLLVLAVGNDRQFARFCRFAGCEALATDKRFATNAGRVRHRQALTSTLAALIAKRPASYWAPGLTEAGVPCSPINNVEQVFADPQVRARGMTIEMAHPAAAGGKTKLIGSPLKLSRTPAHYRHPPPLLGGHNREVLREWLAMEDDELLSLERDGVLGDEETRRREGARPAAEGAAEGLSKGKKSRGD